MPHTLRSDFYSNGIEEPLKEFNQGTEITRFFYLERSYGLHYREANCKVAQEASYKLVRNGAGLN